MDDINPLDVTVVYLSVINQSKIIKCLGYLWIWGCPSNGKDKAGTQLWSH